MDKPSKTQIRWRHAVEYCEEHECKDCFIYKNNLDNRSEIEKTMLHTPCSENIFNYLVQHKLDKISEE